MPVAAKFGASSLRAFGQRGAIPILSDLYFKNTVLLLHGDGTNNAQNSTIIDTSGNSNTITRYGNVNQGTFSPFNSNWSLQIDGSLSNSLYVSMPYTSSYFDWWSTDFTLEAWVNPFNLSTWQDSRGFPSMVGNVSAASETNYWSFGPIANGTVRLYYYNGGPNTVTSTATISTNTWSHIAMTKTSAGITIYVNGVASTTTAVSGTPQSSASFTNGLVVGSSYGASINGMVSNLRIVRGTAIYSGNFTPPTSPLTAVTNTTLLMARSPALIDNSTNNITLTPNGATKVVKYSPFGRTRAYDAASDGGSGFFDGSGDYLSLPANSICSFGSGDFTVEFWMYPTAFYNYVIAFATQSSNADGFFTVAGDSSGNFSAGYYIEGGRPGTSSLPARINSWNHVVAQRASGTTSFYLNGKKATDDYFTTYSLSGADPRIGINPASGSERFTGYLSNFKITKGAALYSGSTITIPSSPVTSSGTNRLLLNFTNGGVIDSAGVNNFETLNDAKISTSQKKFGTGSIYFDGTDDWLQHGNKTEWAWLHNGLQDWTIEWWMYPGSTGAQGIVCTNTNSITGGVGMVMGLGFFDTAGCISGHFTRGVDGNRMDWRTAGNVFSTNTWTHVACMFNRTTKNMSVYVNGTAVSVTNQNVEGNSPTGGDGSAFSYVTSDPSFSLNIGRVVGGVTVGSYYNGYIDDLRITRGVRRYTSNFTVPSKAFPDR